MNKITYLKLCLTVPILAPYLMCLGGWEINILGIAILYSGPIYVAFMIFMYLFTWGMTEDDVIIAIWKSPIYFIGAGVLVGLYFALFQAFRYGNVIEEFFSWLGFSVFFAFFSLIVGYFYVICFMVTSFFIYDAFFDGEIELKTSFKGFNNLPNKAFKHARFTRWDRRTAGPLISR